MTGQQTRSGTRITATTTESESVARDDQLLSLLYVTQTRFNSLETKIETHIAFLHNQTPKATELAPNSLENHNGPPHLVEHQNAPPYVQPTGMGALVVFPQCNADSEKHRPHPEEYRLPDHLPHPTQRPAPAQRLAPNLVV
ncbi:hypothetical protein Fot_32560 [Forsythia ovata]|uniref:Uncharacterized protein n=1 Tax=Forsythia ovata TaxID=205694 RepID=A0ABD1T8K9_9LAMI